MCEKRLNTRSVEDKTKDERDSGRQKMVIAVAFRVLKIVVIRDARKRKWIRGAGRTRKLCRSSVLHLAISKVNSWEIDTNLVARLN